MDIALEKHRITPSHSQIKVRFQARPPQVFSEIQEVLIHISRLPGCISYALTCREQDAFQWSISGSWISAEDRDRHYCSEQIQVLFRCLIQRNAFLICCSEDQAGHLDSVSTLANSYP